MDRCTVNRSGCPRQAAGPLTAALVAVLSIIGLGCASAAPSPYAEPLSAAPVADSSEAQNQSTLAIELHEAGAIARPTGPADHPPPNRLQQVGTIDPIPEPPVVSSAPARTRSTRAAQPVRVVVASVGIDVPVQPTGVAEDGSMALPDTVHRAGWYRYSALPGSTAGSTVIAAHVDSFREGLGPFAALTDSRRGDRIVLTSRDGDRHTYLVTSRRHITRSRLPVADLFDLAGAPRLVLITCGGAYDARNGYHDNVVVLAEPDR
jgi:hypothetical protein